jgi:DNA-binding transcriptional ArsR family regulator
MKIARAFAASPRLEVFFALAAVLANDESRPQSEAVRRWLDQARRKLDQGFRRRLGDQAGSPDLWRRLAALPLPRAAAESPDVDGVIEAVAALPAERFAPASDPEALQLLVVDALRRFDRLAFAAYWRRWREELAGPAPRLEARLGHLSIDAPAPKVETAIFVPSRFAPPGFVAGFDRGGAVLPLDLDRLPSPEAPPSPLPRVASAPRDPALVFRALGDATRYTIAGLIARTPMTSAELARRLGVSKPTLAHHLRELRIAGLVLEARSGNRIALSLDRAALESLSGAALAALYAGAEAAPLRRSRRPARRQG